MKLVLRICLFWLPFFQDFANFPGDSEEAGVARHAYEFEGFSEEGVESFLGYWEVGCVDVSSVCGTPRFLIRLSQLKASKISEDQPKLVGYVECTQSYHPGFPHPCLNLLFMRKDVCQTVPRQHLDLSQLVLHVAQSG